MFQANLAQTSIQDAKNGSGNGRGDGLEVDEVEVEVLEEKKLEKFKSASMPAMW